MSIIDELVNACREQYGAEWTGDDEANLRFTIDAERLMQEIEGVHLMGDPEIENGAITLRLWVDQPLPDLMSADMLAYEVFGRISEEIFCTERKFESQGLRYPFVTGSPRHGHIGSIVLSGPHAANFADRFRHRVAGDIRYQA